MTPVLLCLDSGTTALKAGAFGLDGRRLAALERPNGALHRTGLRVEQDMEQTRAEALSLLAALRDALGPHRVEGIVLTGQGDGLWPVDAQGAPVGRALTWLDGRARGLAAELPEALDAVQAITGSRLTAASQSLQLLWLQRHDPARLAKIRHALRLKEWLFLALTGRVLAEPSAVLPAWGRWQSQRPVAAVPEILGLDCGLRLLPEIREIAEARAPLAAPAAGALALPEGLPVLLGPGDVHATLIGLGLGLRPGVRRASIFGTSAIHAALVEDPETQPAPPAGAAAPAGAMVQKFAMGPGYICFHPCFNGATLLQHLDRQFTGLPRPAPPAYSGLILHPFFEPGGERAPWTDPHARGALLGLNAATSPAQIAWAGREALAFAAHHSHSGLTGTDPAANGAQSARTGEDGAGPAPQRLALGGGLAQDRAFAGFLASLTGLAVERRTDSQAGLQGLAALGAHHLLGLSLAEVTRDWITPPDDCLAPVPGKVADYARRKYDSFTALVAATAPRWAELAALDALAEGLGA